MNRQRTDIRNVAIIAHVDHGKTTLVDALLRQSGMFRDGELQGECIMDSNPLERERGITILAKNCAITCTDASGNRVRINLIDTPGHADFGGEVERVLSMADGALLLVDAAEGPMPQTRFVLRKAFEHGLRPVVIINKIDRPDARAHEVLDEVFELFMELGADDRTLDFPVLYASGRHGVATWELEKPGRDIRPVFEALLRYVPAPAGDADGPLRMRISTIHYNDYVGRIGVGRIHQGRVASGQTVKVCRRDGSQFDSRVLQVQVFNALDRKTVDEAEAGDIVALVGLESVEIGDSICDVNDPQPLPAQEIEPPTLTMMFSVNDSPFAGRDGRYVTSRNLRDRLMRELESNVALRVEETPGRDALKVSGRGLLHLGVLVETMRREGYEMSISKPHVILRSGEDGSTLEPLECLMIEAPENCLGAIMELAGNRRGELVRVDRRSAHVFLEFIIPARGLIGMRTRLMTATAGEAVMHHNFHGYGAMRGQVPRRACGVMVSNATGRATAYALNDLQLRGTMFVEPGDEVYEGQIVGEHCRENDIVVNPTRTKRLTNIRTTASDENIILKPARKMTLEEALEYIEEDELVEVTPRHVRLRKELLKEHLRKRAARAQGTGGE